MSQGYKEGNEQALSEERHRPNHQSLEQLVSKASPKALSPKTNMYMASSGWKNITANQTIQWDKEGNDRSIDRPHRREVVRTGVVSQELARQLPWKGWVSIVVCWAAMLSCIEWYGVATYSVVSPRVIPSS